MTGTEMFDAIAYIDEDLIDRCLAVKAVKAADKAVTADEGAAVRRRRWAPYAALAAVLVLAIALAAALRLGRSHLPKPLFETWGTDPAKGPFYKGFAFLAAGSAHGAIARSFAISFASRVV